MKNPFHFNICAWLGCKHDDRVPPVLAARIHQLKKKADALKAIIEQQKKDQKHGK